MTRLKNYSLVALFFTILNCKQGIENSDVSYAASNSTRSQTSLKTDRGTSTSSQSSNKNQKTCLPDFPYKDGWLGGDAVFSVSLGGTDEKTLWMFGDTFINTDNPQQRSGPNATIVANSIAISQCDQGQFQLDYFWKKKDRFGSGQHQAFFTGDGRDIWPGGGVIIDKKLHIFGMIVHKDPKLPGGFAVEGTRLITVDNYQESPESWTPRFKDFGTGKDILVGISNIVAEPYLLLYSSLHTQKGQPMTLMRCPLKQIETCRPELLTNSGWKNYDGKLDDAKILLNGAGTEFSVAKIDTRYIATFNSIRDFFPAADLTIAFAKQPEDEFSEPKKVLRFPSNAEFGGTKQAYCYAAKEHSHLRQGNTAIMTYVCNSFDFLGETVSNLKLYQVRVLKTDLSVVK